MSLRDTLNNENCLYCQYMAFVGLGRRSGSIGAFEPVGESGPDVCREPSIVAKAQAWSTRSNLVAFATSPYQRLF